MDSVDYFNIFFNCIDKINPITDDDKQLCYDHFEVHKFDKNTLIEKAGKVHLYQNFVVSGILRKHTLEETGQEVTTAINTEPCFFSCYASVIEGKVSDENLETITDSVLLRIKREDIEYLFKHGKTIHQYTILLFHKIIEEQKQKALDLVNLTAKERYLKFTTQHPHLIQSVPLQHIASLLGITPQSLSRIRKEI
ncbi:MAG: Crp/Fnr family transcriptional regulator [Bacteroidia bacterium]